MVKFELNLSMEELEKRTNKDYLMTKKMLKSDAPEFLELAQGRYVRDTERCCVLRKDPKPRLPAPHVLM